MHFARLFAFILGLCFIGFASVQYNDPDAVTWIAVYFTAAVLSFMIPFGKVKTAVMAIACIAYAAGAVYCWPETYEGIEVGSGRLQNIEEAREALGLLIAGASIALLGFLSKDDKHSKGAMQVKKTKPAG